MGIFLFSLFGVPMLIQYGIVELGHVRRDVEKGAPRWFYDWPILIFLSAMMLAATGVWHFWSFVQAMSL